MYTRIDFVTQKTFNLVLQLDSGSPVVINNTLIGIQSCEPNDINFPIIFTNVYSYVSWITNEIKDRLLSDNYPAGYKLPNW